MATIQHDLNALAKIITRAFFDDPLFTHFFPDAQTRQAHAHHTFKFILAHANKKGHISTTPDAVRGVSIWLPSAKTQRGIIDQIRFGALNMFAHQSKQSLQRQIQASDHMKALHQQLLSQPHWYLSILAVDPQHQGQGLATAIMSPMLQTADRQQLPCSLDTHNPNNVSLYRRYGFEVAHHGKMPNSDVKHWVMIRPPQPAK